MNTSNLRKRVLFALWAIPLGWWIVNSNFSLLSLIPSSIVSKYPGLSGVRILPANILAVVLTYMAAAEYISMLSKLYPKNGFWLIYVWLGYQAISYFVPDNLLSWNKDTYILLMLVAVEAFVWGKNTKRWRRASLLFSGTTFLVIALLSMLDFYSELFHKVFPARFDHTMLSQLGIVFVVGAIFLCDSAAFFAGSYFGKHHFSSISPKKTVEGSIAGLLISIITVGIGWHFFADDKYPLILGIILGLLTGLFAQIGDLLVSLIKRYFNVKDSSNIIPGHGGILDRFDSVFFAAPIINLYLIIITRLIP
jgi:phosphatidate cytidylyltransferase